MPIKIELLLSGHTRDRTFKDHVNDGVQHGIPKDPSASR